MTRGCHDFMANGPREEFKKLLDEMEQRLQLSDVVRLFEDGDEGTFLSLGIRKITGGYKLKGKTSLVEDVPCGLGSQEANPTGVPQTMSENKQAGDDKPLEAVEHRTYRGCVGKLLLLAAHRADVQHGVGVLSEALSAPTMRDQRRLKKTARFLAGTKEVELLLRPNATNGKPVVQVMVDANWDDDAIDRTPTSGGVLYFYGCSIATWSRRQSCVALCSAESELYAQGSSAVEALGLPRCWSNGVNRRSLCCIETAAARFTSSRSTDQGA